MTKGVIMMQNNSAREPSENRRYRLHIGWGAFAKECFVVEERGGGLRFAVAIIDKSGNEVALSRAVPLFTITHKRASDHANPAEGAPRKPLRQ